MICVRQKKENSNVAEAEQLNNNYYYLSNEASYVLILRGGL